MERSQKKVVYYASHLKPHYVIGQAEAYALKMNRGHFGVFPIPLNHPDSARVSNNVTVQTSPVVQWDQQTGEIETQNTLYRPGP